MTRSFVRAQMFPGFDGPSLFFANGEPSEVAFIPTPEAYRVMDHIQAGGGKYWGFVQTFQMNALTLRREVIGGPMVQIPTPSAWEIEAREMLAKDRAKNGPTVRVGRR